MRRWPRAVATAFLSLIPLLITTLLFDSPARAQTEPYLRDRSLYGTYVPDLPSGRVDLPAVEGDVGAMMQIASSFTDWSYVFGGPNDIWQAAGNTRKVLYSWEPFGFRFTSVTNGEQDAYLQRIVDSMKNYPYDIYVRPWGEMNANWSSWQPTPGGEKPYGGTPSEFIAAWRHMVNYFHSRNVFNLKFLFNPDAADFSNNTPIPTIWPGAEYVDVLAIDGYNWGKNSATGDTWREFDVIFPNMYNILTGLHPTAPVWIAEFGSKEPQYNDGAPADPANSKGRWFDNMMQSRLFPRLTALAYFNVKKERDWRMESSDDSLNGISGQLAARGPTPSTTTTTTAPPSTTTTTTRPPSTTTTTTTGPTTTTTTTRPPSSTTTTTTRPPSSTTTTTTAPTNPPTPVDVKNPSLEEAATGDANLPKCFQTAGYGQNTATWVRQPAGHTGDWSQLLTVAQLTDGDRKLVIDQNDPACAPAVQPGATYQLRTWYYSTVPTQFVAYYRTAAGAWEFWAQSPSFPASQPWSQAVWTTPAMPAGATALSFGLSLDRNGVLAVDDFSLGVFTSNVVPNPSLEQDTNNDGTPDCWQRAGWGTNTVSWARTNDAHTGDWAFRIQVSGYASGDRKLIVPTQADPACAPAATAGKRYTLSGWYKSTVPVVLVAFYRDPAGVWQYWTETGSQPASSSYRQASFTTPALPAGATAISFGFALAANGTMTVDDHSMVPAS